MHPEHYGPPGLERILDAIHDHRWAAFNAAELAVIHQRLDVPLILSVPGEAGDARALLDEVHAELREREEATR